MMSTAVSANGHVIHNGKIVGYIQGNPQGRKFLYRAISHVDGAGPTIRRGDEPVADVQRHFGQKTLADECARLLGLSDA